MNHKRSVRSFTIYLMSFQQHIPYKNPARSLYLICLLPPYSWSLAISVLAYSDITDDKIKPTTPPTQPRGTIIMPAYPRAKALLMPVPKTIPTWNHESAACTTGEMSTIYYIYGKNHNLQISYCTVLHTFFFYNLHLNGIQDNDSKTTQ